MQAFQRTIRRLSKQAAVLIAVFLLVGFAGPPLLKKYAGVIGAPAAQPSLPDSRLHASLPAREEEVSFRNGDVPLSGTLVLPETRGPHPAIIVLGGSGWRTRGQVIHVARRLAPRGIATLVFDKRSYGRSGGSQPYSFAAVARDAIAAVHELQQHPAIDPRQIGLYGVSRGGWHAPLAASMSNDVAFLVLFVAPAVTPVQQETHRVEHTMRADGYSEEDIGDAVDFMRNKFHYAFTGEGWDIYSALKTKGRKNGWDSYVGGADSKDSRAWEWMRMNMRYDPIPALEKVTCPVLALFGELDRNVLPRVNKPLWETALRRAGNRDFKLVVVPRANHGLRLATTGGRKERSGPPSPEVWPAVYTFLAEHLDLRR